MSKVVSMLGYREKLGSLKRFALTTQAQDRTYTKLRTAGLSESQSRQLAKVINDKSVRCKSLPADTKGE